MEYKFPKKNTINKAQLSKLENDASIKMKNMKDFAKNRNPDMQLRNIMKKFSELSKDRMLQQNQLKLEKSEPRR